MSKKNGKTSDEAKVQQEVIGEMPAVFKVEENTTETEKKDVTEIEADTIQTERKVIALVILGNLHAVIGILKEYKWKDKDSKAIWEACVKLNKERKHISISTVQIALNAENLGDADIESILSDIPSPNLLIPFANKLIKSQGE